MHLIVQLVINSVAMEQWSSLKDTAQNPVSSSAEKNLQSGAKSGREWILVSHSNQKLNPFPTFLDKSPYSWEFKPLHLLSVPIGTQEPQLLPNSSPFPTAEIPIEVLVALLLCSRNTMHIWRKDKDNTYLFYSCSLQKGSNSHTVLRANESWIIVSSSLFFSPNRHPSLFSS